MTFLGTERFGLLGRQVVAPDQLPDQAVVERELVDPAVADAVDPRVADVGDQGPFGQEQEGRAGRPHPLEVAVGAWPGCGSGRRPRGTPW